MKLEKTLRRRLHSQETLLDAVSAMKSLSAHHFRLSRAALQPARSYRDGIVKILRSVPFPPTQGTSSPGLLSIATDRGLCGGYTSRLVHKAMAENEKIHFGLMYCIGRRQLHFWKRSGIKPAHTYPSPTSVSGITRVLLDVAQKILASYLDDRCSALYVVSARFDGVGAFTPVSTQVLPVNQTGPALDLPASGYVSRRHLMAVVLREFLYITLYEILVDALASEHGARLAATQSAEEWLQNRTAETKRSIASIHREVTTQEILDIVAGARRGRGLANKRRSEIAVG